MKTKIIFLVMLIGAGFLMLSLHVGAGSLEPAKSPAPTMHTLEEVYTRIKQLVPESWRSHPTESQVTQSYAIQALVVGESQGNIQGSCEDEGLEETISCVGWEHRVYVPHDADSGQITSGDKHDPVTIIKYIDKATVNLYKAMCQNEVLVSVEIRFYRTTAKSQNQQYYEVRLEDARIVEMKEITPNLESVTMLYESITWEWFPDSMEHTERPHQTPGG